MDGKAQREGASNGKRLTVTMEVDTLDCPICFEPLRPPIFQLGLHVLQRNRTDYFFLLKLSLVAAGHAISIICVQPSTTEPKFTCNMNYDCSATGFCESSSCHIRSSSLSDGFPEGFELILPKGKIPDDRNGILLRITIHQALSVSRASLQGKGPTPAPQGKVIAIALQRKLRIHCSDS